MGWQARVAIEAEIYRARPERLVLEGRMISGGIEKFGLALSVGLFEKIFLQAESETSMKMPSGSDN
jgi:hypothetical protein